MRQGLKQKARMAPKRNQRTTALQFPQEHRSCHAKGSSEESDKDTCSRVLKEWY